MSDSIEHASDNVARTEIRNDILKECEPVQSEQASRYKKYVQSKCDDLTFKIRKYIEERRAGAEGRAEVQQDIKKAEMALWPPPQDSSKEEKDRLRIDLLCLYVAIAEMDMNMKLLAADELASRAALDSYLKVTLLCCHVMTMLRLTGTVEKS